MISKIAIFVKVYVNPYDMIRILQISDIHFHHKPVDEDEFVQMKVKFHEDIQACRKIKGAPFDHIFICGDIAFSGQHEEYETANVFINDIKDISGASNIFTVPGNHDLSWEAYPTYRRTIRDTFIKSSSDFISKCRVKEPLALKPLYAPFYEYCHFAKEYHLVSDVASKFIFEDKDVLESKDRFYWSQEIGNENGYLFRLVGLNTALASDKEDKEHLQALPNQMWAAIKRQNNEVNILMAHHPLTWINYGKTIENRLDSLFHVQFYGHEHIQSIKSDKTIKIFSGAFQPDTKEEVGEKYAPTYNVIEISVEKDRLKVNIESRKWDGELFAKYPECDTTHYVPLISQDSWTSIVQSGSTVDSAYQINKAPELQNASKQIFALTQFFLQIDKRIQKKIMNELYPEKYNNSINSGTVHNFIRCVNRDRKYEEFTEAFAKYYPK